MKNTPLPALLLTALSALALSSCSWNIGRCIRDTAITHTGVDTTHPIGNVVYKAKEGEFYMQAPEVTFHPSHKMIRGLDFHEYGKWNTEEPVYATGLKPTGRLLWVKVSGGRCIFADGAETYDLSGVLEVVDAPPSHLKAVPIDENARIAPGADIPIERCGTLDTKHAAGYPLAVAAAAPFQYVVDPALDVVGNTAVTVIAVPCVTITYPIAWLVFQAFPQN